MDDDAVQKHRAWAGALVVSVGVAAVAAAAIVATAWLPTNNLEGLTAVLSTAFMTIAAITSTYFGVRGASNAAHGAVSKMAQMTAQTGTPPLKR